MSKRLTDAELELEKARHMARTMDLILEAFATQPTFEVSVICTRCGRKSFRHSRDPKAPAEILGVCNTCMDG